MAAAILGLVVLAGGCEREQRTFRQLPPAANGQPITPTGMQGNRPLPPPVQMATEKNAYDLSEGQRLYEWFNCTGCHAHGGGGMGPPLMDNKWLYGGQPGDIFKTIVDGRPNGMPAFRGRIPDQQVWQLVAYVRSLSGQAPSDAAPGRQDNMSVKKPESRTPKQGPVRSKNAPWESPR